MESTNICRICAENKESSVGIYEPVCENLAIKEKLFKCLHIKVFLNDCLPLRICTECFDLLNKFNEFFEKSKQAQNRLNDMFFECKIKSDSQASLDSQESDDNFVQSEEISNTFDEPILWNKNKLSTRNDFSKQSIPITTKVKAHLHTDSSRSYTNIKENTMHYRNNDESPVRIPNNYMIGTDSYHEALDVPEKSSDTRKSLNKINKRYPWLCTDCDEKSTSLEALKDHHCQVHNQKPKFMCVQCCKVFNTYNGFCTHVKRHDLGIKFECQVCQKAFPTKKKLDAHKFVHSQERPLICETCGKTFKHRKGLYVHNKSHLPREMKYRYSCDQCDKKFPSSSSLNTHKKSHGGVRNYTCDQCGRSFMQKGNLESHFLTHSEDRPFKCDQCSLSFKTLGRLKKHIITHTDDKPFKCSVCKKDFREKHNLKEHERIHTGEMPFACEFCGKTFRFQGILTTHRRTHTGERPYSCKECRHDFTNWPNYNKHMKRRHGVDMSSRKKEKNIVEDNQENIGENQSQNASPTEEIYIEAQVKEEQSNLDEHFSRTKTTDSMITHSIDSTSQSNFLQTSLP